jgi:ABC-type branched-subunit amino acid transport system substrate-binding protein
MKLRGVAVLVALLVVAAACTSSKPDTATPPTSAAPTTHTTTGVTDTEIKVSALGYKASYGEALVGAQARFKRQNDAGGVYGRKIVLTDFNDDNQTPATDSQMATKIVEQDKPFAIVPVMTATFAAADYLNQQGVPFVGWGIDTSWCNKNAGFSLTGCTDETKTPYVSNFVPSFEQVFADKSAKGKAIALIGADDDSAKVALASFANVWTYNDANVVYKSNDVPLPPTVVADYTPYAQAIMSSNGGKGPDLVEAVSSTLDGAGIAKKLRELGYKNQIIEYSLYDPRIASLSNGVYNALTFASWEQTNTQSVRQMITDVNAVDSTATKGLAMEAGYWSADLFIQILEKAGRNLSRESFIAAGNDNFTMNGQQATSNIEFPKGHTESSAGLSIVFGTGTGYTVTSPFTPQPLIPRSTFLAGLAAKKAK